MLHPALECLTVHGETNAKDKTDDWDIISTARISSKEGFYNMPPDAAAGLTAEMRKVNYAMLHLCSNEQNRRSIAKNILNNHTSEPSLRMRSIAINIEIETLRGSYDEAERQLGIWVDNHFRYMRATFGEVPKVLPLLIVRGEDWYFLAAKHDRGQANEPFKTTVWGNDTMHFGSTIDVARSTKVIAGLRSLYLWTMHEYANWWKRLP